MGGRKGEGRGSGQRLLLRDLRAATLAKLVRTLYNDPMTELLERAIASALRLDPAAQDVIARTIIMLTGNEEPSPVDLTPEDEAAIALSRAQTARGEFATEEQVRAVWAKHGL